MEDYFAPDGVWRRADGDVVGLEQLRAFLARRGTIEPGSELFGRAFENWVFHELCCYNSYCDRFAEFSFWRLSTGGEVDFIGSLSFRARPH